MSTFNSISDAELVREFTDVLKAEGERRGLGTPTDVWLDDEDELCVTYFDPKTSDESHWVFDFTVALVRKTEP